MTTVDEMLRDLERFRAAAQAVVAEVARILMPPEVEMPDRSDFERRYRRQRLRKARRVRVRG